MAKIGGPTGGGNNPPLPIPKPKTASITIEKQASHDGGKRFGFATKGLKPKDFKLGDDDERDFRNVKPGTYTVTEDKANGWTLDKLVCHDPSHNTTVDVKKRTATIKVAAGEHVTCTFTDTKTKGKR